MLSSGLQSPYYLDLGVLYSKPESFKKITFELNELIRHKTDDEHIIGIPLRGLVYAISTSYSLKRKFLVFRKNIKKHGTKNMIEGKWKEGDAAVLIDDVASSGSSLLDVAFQAQKIGFKISKAFVIVDRCQGAKEKLLENKIELISCIDIYMISQSLYELGKISKVEYDQIVSYSQSKK
jgi:uridine monophosphate synthetase